MPSKTTQTPCIFKINARSLTQNLPQVTYTPYICQKHFHASFKRVIARVALPAFKAYIELDNAAGATAPLFIALPTTVEATKAQNTRQVLPMTSPVVAYNRPAKGQVYVRDGKKFVQQQNSSYV